MARAGFRKNKSVEKNSLELASPDRFAFRDTKDAPTKRNNRLDPLTERLGEVGYYHKMRWSWFAFEFGGALHPLEVSRFYQKINLAVDIGATDQDMIRYKKQLLESHGIKYACLGNAADFESLVRGIA